MVILSFSSFAKNKLKIGVTLQPYYSFVTNIVKDKADVIHAMNTTDKDIMELVSGENYEWNTENSNKDAALLTTQRDYIEGIVSVNK